MFSDMQDHASLGACSRSTVGIDSNPWYVRRACEKLAAPPQDFESKEGGTELHELMKQFPAPRGGQPSPSLYGAVGDVGSTSQSTSQHPFLQNQEPLYGHPLGGREAEGGYPSALTTVPRASAPLLASDRVPGAFGKTGGYGYPASEATLLGDMRAGRHPWPQLASQGLAARPGLVSGVPSQERLGQAAARAVQQHALPPPGLADCLLPPGLKSPRAAGDVGVPYTSTHLPSSLASPPAKQMPLQYGYSRQRQTEDFNVKGRYDLARAQQYDENSTNDDGERHSLGSFPSDEDGAATLAVPAAPLQGMTTLMVRNVPVLYTQEMLLQEWPNKGTYDFLYLPRSCGGQTNLSYAFINFVSEDQAMAFKTAWHKRRLPHFTSRKPLNISFADVQGLHENLMQLKKKRVRRVEMRQCQPVIIKHGRHFHLSEALDYLESCSRTGVMSV